MKIVTSVTMFNDAIGTRISMTYSEIDETTGRVVADNERIDRVVTDEDIKSKWRDIQSYAQTFIVSE